LKYIKSNRKQLQKLKKFINVSNTRQNIHFVFVSEWLQNSCESDLGVSILHKHVIPNSIDTDRFSFNMKNPEQRKKILAIRSFNARNYANDILVDVILQLSNKPYFSELSFSIYGEGYLFNNLTKKINQFKNVSLHNYFVPNESIPALHRQHGTFFCFSRLDSQGVSMCEAMSSGLVTFTNNVAAIPEFVEDGASGFVSNNIEEIIKSMDLLYQSSEVFFKISEQGSRSIEQKCGLSIVIPREVNLILQLTNR
jgi:glycosyltransferase involved in cell wall biosynthesis